MFVFSYLFFYVLPIKWKKIRLLLLDIDKHDKHLFIFFTELNLVNYNSIVHVWIAYFTIMRNNVELSPWNFL